MAIALGIFSSFLPAQKVRLCKSSSSTFTTLYPANLRLSRSLTISAASNPERDTSGTMKRRRVSPEMQEFLGGVPEIPGTQCLDQIFAYIEQNNLQDPADWRFIMCDAKLKNIFGGKDRVSFLEIHILMDKNFLD